jgi:hypothetical protein
MGMNGKSGLLFRIRVNIHKMAKMKSYSTRRMAVRLVIIHGISTKMVDSFMRIITE